MWAVHYKLDRTSRPWALLGYYETRTGAIIKAYQVSATYVMIRVTDIDGRIIWSN